MAHDGKLWTYWSRVGRRRRLILEWEDPVAAGQPLGRGPRCFLHLGFSFTDIPSLFWAICFLFKDVKHANIQQKSKSVLTRKFGKMIQMSRPALDSRECPVLRSLTRSLCPNLCPDRPDSFPQTAFHVSFYTPPHLLPLLCPIEQRISV